MKWRKSVAVPALLLTLAILSVMPGSVLTLSAEDAATPSRTSEQTPPPAGVPATVCFDPQRVTSRMVSGMGASWHAIRCETPLKGRGSAWGGNPPLAFTNAWEQIESCARWLGMDFIRVEIDQRMYQAELGRFDFDNEEMRTLYRILDWCERTGADVFLQQMWPHVAWNTPPGRDPVHSVPLSLEDHAEGLATLVRHLVTARRYTCIRWIAIVNEPVARQDWSWWQDPAGPIPLRAGLQAVRKALDRRGISIPLSGPDWNFIGGVNPEELDFDPVIGAYDLHTYEAFNPAAAAKWVEYARSKGKPFLLTEFGNMALGWGESNPGPKSYAAVLSNARTVMLGLNVGVGAFNRWSFLNRGDLDGQWQLVRTWDMEARRYLKQASPEPVAYYGYGIFTRFSAPRSEVLGQTVDPGDGKVLAAALRSPKGNLSLWVANIGSETRPVTVRIPGNRSFNPYRISEAELGKPGFRLCPGAPVTAGDDGIRLLMDPCSIVCLSTFRLEPDDPGITRDE